MKKTLVGIFLCLLMTTSTVLPISGSILAKESSQPLIKGNIQYAETEKIFNDLKVKLDTVTTKQEALMLFKETIIELHNQGLLPKGTSIQRAQRLITMNYLKNELLHPSQKSIGNDTGNTNCLVFGFATKTYFRPYPSIIMDIPIIEYLVFDSNLSKYFNYLAWFYAMRVFSSIKFGPYAYVGSRYKGFEDGNITDKIYSASGFVWTLGSNGMKRWNGSFYGGLYTKYGKTIFDNHSYEFWDPVGIRGFVGINFFNFVSFASGGDFPSFYIGFAREVNFTYSPPWS
jgi:hypothetical protein